MRKSRLCMKFETLWSLVILCNIPDKFEFLHFFICQIQGAVNPLKPNHLIKHFLLHFEKKLNWSKTDLIMSRIFFSVAESYTFF